MLRPSGLAALLGLALLAGCMRNTTGDASLAGSNSTPGKVCNGILGERTELLYVLLPQRIQRKTALADLWLRFKLPKGGVKRCRLLSLEPALAVQKTGKGGKLLTYPKIKGVYRLTGEDRRVEDYELYFIKEGGKWWLLPTYDSY